MFINYNFPRFWSISGYGAKILFRVCEGYGWLVTEVAKFAKGIKIHVTVP